MSKALRQKTILAILDQGPVASQEELQRSLHKRGFDVGQATLSRDIHEIGLVKTGEGYAIPGADTGFPSSLPSLPSVARLVREFVLDVRAAQNLLVLKTT